MGLKADENQGRDTRLGATVQEQVQRLDQLAGDVMDTARADGGRLTLNRATLSVADLLDAAAGRFRATHAARTLTHPTLSRAGVRKCAVHLASWRRTE